MSDHQALAPTRGQYKSLKECQSLGEAFNSPEFLERIKASVPSHMKPSRLLRTFVQATSRAPLLLQCNMRSVLGAMLTCSEVGLEPNTPLQHAFLIPFGKYKWNKSTRERELQGYEVQLIFGYPGLLDLSYRTGQMGSVHADVVWKADQFSFAYGTDAHLRHIPSGRHEPEEEPFWAYAHANLKHGQAFEALPWADVLRIRNGSQGFRSALAAREAAEAKGWRPPASWTEAPWVKYQPAMARKTAFRALSKWLPKSVELAAAVALDEQQDHGTVDFGAVLDGEVSVVEGGGFEDVGPLVEDEMDATAAFGLRSVANAPEAEPEPKTETKPPRATRKPPVETEKVTSIQARQAPPVPEPAPVVEPERPMPTPTIGKSPGWTAWLVDGDGVPIPDETGRIGRFDDPVAFARALTNAVASAFPADADLIRMANAEDAAEAARISPEAAAILTPKPEPEIREPDALPPAEPEPPHEPEPPQPDPLQLEAPAPTKAGWEAWLERWSAALATATTPDQLSHAIVRNEPIYRDFPARFRLAAKTAMEARQKQLTTRPLPTPQELHDGLMRDINAANTLDEIQALGRNAAVVGNLHKLAIADRALADKVKTAAREKEKKLLTATQAPPA